MNVRVWLLGILGGCVGGGLLLPLRHHVRLESAPGNPVQRIVLESRSWVGLLGRAWGASVSGTTVWGSAETGFFLAPVRPVRVTVKAWPTFRRALEVHPTAAWDAYPRPTWDAADREAFRAWFVALVEDQLDRVSPAWEPAQRDCAGLLRFAFREALAPKTPAWAERVAYGGPFVARSPSLRGLEAWRSGFPTPDGWQPFARGAFLRDYACVPVGMEPTLGRPGDLLFFGRGGARSMPDHAMVFGRTDADGMPVLIYHTGEEGSARMGRDAGALRRVRLVDLLQHPDPAFRPQPENPAFLGVFRWKLLADVP